MCSCISLKRRTPHTTSRRISTTQGWPTSSTVRPSEQFDGVRLEVVHGVYDSWVRQTNSTLLRSRTMLSTSVEPRRTLTPRLAYAHVAAVIGLALFASGTPSPLYTHLPRAVGLLAGRAHADLRDLRLRRAGRAAARRPALDEIGRRPVLLAALGTLMATTVLFMLADSTAWLFVARGIQGVATGLALGAASAALLDLHPDRNPAQVGLTNGVVSAGGMGLGVLISATLVELAPAPRVLPYVVLLVLFAIAFAGALRMPEPVTNRARCA